MHGRASSPIRAQQRLQSVLELLTLRAAALLALGLGQLGSWSGHLALLPGVWPPPGAGACADPPHPQGATLEGQAPAKGATRPPNRAVREAGHVADKAAEPVDLDLCASVAGGDDEHLRTGMRVGHSMLLAENRRLRDQVAELTAELAIAYGHRRPEH